MARGQILTGYAGLARSLGLVPERLARAAGLDLSAAVDLDARIPVKAYSNLLEASARAAGLENFGLRLAESRELGILGPIGILVREETDLRSALDCLARYLSFHNEALRLSLRDEEGPPLLSLEVALPPHAGVRQITELSVGAFFRIIRRLAGPEWRPRAIWFQHAAAEAIAPYRRFFGCPVAFGQAVNAILLAATDLEAPIAMSDTSLAAYARRYLDSVLIQHDSASILEQVRELVRLRLASGCDADKVAEALGVDRRTIHRRLEEHGETFSSVREQVRRETAERLLASSRPLIEIAEQLGFSGTAVFSRWFKGAYGHAPGRWREQRVRKG